MGTMLKQFNVTNIAILAKVKDPKTFVYFRLISLCNIVYKIFTKEIYLKLQPFISSIISKEQGGFVPGREIVEGEIVAHKVLHSINMNHLPTVIVKLGMIKSYDRVE